MLQWYNMHGQELDLEGQPNGKMAKEPRFVFVEDEQEEDEEEEGIGSESEDAADDGENDANEGVALQQQLFEALKARMTRMYSNREGLMDEFRQTSGEITRLKRLQAQRKEVLDRLDQDLELAVLELKARWRPEFE